MKTDWKAKLKTVLETKQKSEPASKTALTKADNTISFKKDSSAFVSRKLITFPGNSESATKTAKQMWLPKSRSDEVSSVYVSGHLVDSSEKFCFKAQIKSDKMHESLNRLVDAGIVFDVSTTDFLIIDNDKRLTESDNRFLESNYQSVLCELQQSLLTKHLFSNSPECLEDFIFEVRERESILTETDEMTLKIYCDASMQTTKKWFDSLLRNI